MAEYTLTAEFSWQENTLTTSTQTFEALGNSTATARAIEIILFNAYKDPNGLWAKAKITLTDSTGKILHEMPSK